ncbi:MULTISPECIES: carbohydrate ABC transporter permease [unclassified Paenibacillus]|jgi:putative aldouronate transport system permease protein|uniref:carbohydrate ABC transporter permease n=1 Tax=unclassified Paenibacillus TaxID=185978 RepID=UPI00096F0A36|nr:carbohydrate ABC transporter permease [Paenibacillus sp. FSL H7-0331]OMF02643.1 ABC transporter permease [Paenibacillus sp. FSL H7-0331]
MVEHPSWSRRLFIISNYVLLVGLSLLCILPLINVFAISLSSSSAAAAGFVKLWPVEFTWKAYAFIVQKPEFIRSLVVTLQRVALGVTLNMVLVILVAYPLSKDAKALKGRTLYAWIFVFTMLFNGGLIPLYMTIKALGLLDSIWALVLHHALPVFNILILLNFFRGLPKELEEAAFMDGAGHWTVLWRIFVPLSTPSLATLLLFSIVGQWNAWFDGIIFMNSPHNYPLQSYLYTVITAVDTLLAGSVDMEMLAEVSDRTAKSAQIFLGALPILLVYPFIQRFFMKGIVLGSVKE